MYVGVFAVGIGMLHYRPMVAFFYFFFKLEGLVYFCLGLWIRENVKKVSHFSTLETQRNLMWLALGIGLLFVLLFALIFQKTGLYLTDVARVIFVPPLLFAFWHFIPSCSLPNWLTRSTFAVFVMHGVVLRIIEMAVRHPIETIPQWLVRWAFAFTVPIVVAVLLRRTAPGVSRVLFGGR